MLLGKLAGAMLASLSQAVYLLNAPIAQVARLAGALEAKAQQDPSILAGGAGTPAPADEPATDEVVETVETESADSAEEADGHVGTEDEASTEVTDEATESEDPTEA